MPLSAAPGRRSALALPVLLGLLLGVAGCGDSTAPDSRFTDIPVTAPAFDRALRTVLVQTLTVQGVCKSPYFINCPDSVLDPPVLVDLSPSLLTLTPTPQASGSFSHVVTLRVRTRRDVAFTMGTAACRLSLEPDSVEAHLVAGGTARRMDPTDSRPYAWIYLFTEMMTGLQPGMVRITGDPGCDAGSFDPHLLSVLIGEMIPKQVAICLPESGAYRVCPDSMSAIRP
ncbi:MAG: hypothetical protein U0133_11905 [Gemmatimonadales bacterium]